MRVLILLLVASACIVQTLAAPANTNADVDQVKDKDGAGKSVVGTGADPNAAEAQNTDQVSKGSTVTELVTNGAKGAFSMVHKKISQLAGNKGTKQSGEQQQQQQPAQAQEGKHLSSGQAGESQKVHSRSKRSPVVEPKKQGVRAFLSKVKSFVRGKPPKTVDNTEPKVESKTESKASEASTKKVEATEKAEPKTVESESVTKAGETKVDESDGEEIESDDKDEHVRRKRSLTGGEPKKEEGLLKRLSSKLSSFGRSSKSEPQEQKSVQQPRRQEKASGKTNGGAEDDDDDDDDLNEIVL